MLRISERTLLDWGARWTKDRLSPESRGRPRKGADRNDKAKLLGLLWVLGPTTGWETLREYFPGVSRSEMRKMLSQTRRLWSRLDRVGALALTWKKPGTVWAMDFAEPPGWIEGRYPQILIVRDLASGMSLLALPCSDATAPTAIAALKSLFLEHGAPLVLKADNGAAFIAQAMRDFLYEHGVTLLCSPPYWPTYNGAVEAGVGSIKTRAHHLSSRAGRPGQWTLDDVEGARLLANELGRPFGAAGPRAWQGWDARTPIDQDLRDAFLEDVARNQDSEWQQQGYSPEAQPGKTELASMERAAIARTLCEHGLLEFKTRRVSPPIAAFLSASIS